MPGAVALCPSAAAVLGVLWTSAGLQGVGCVVVLLALD
jgi:hypothetical protein